MSYIIWLKLSKFQYPLVIILEAGDEKLQKPPRYKTYG